MPPQPQYVRIPSAELERLHARLTEAEDTLKAIRTGEVDALVVHSSHGDQLFTLQGAEQPYRVFVEHMQQGAVTFSVGGIILYANSYFAAFVQLPLQKLIGSSLFALLSPEDAAKVRAMIAHPTDGPEDISLRPPHAEARPVRVAFHEMNLPENARVIGLVVTDLSGHHERQRLVSALEEIRLRQEQLRRQNEDLSLARTQLENANQAKDQFLAALSHELRTPLTPVLLSAAALATDPHIPEDLRNELSMICRNVELEARLIDDLLDLTRITSGKLDSHPQPIDTHEILRDALEICQSDIRIKNFTLQCDFDARESWIHGDPVRIQQVFWNLLRNAVKFTPQQGSIHLRTRNVPATALELQSLSPAPTASMLTIEIADTGIGIAPHSIPRLFNAFEQEHASTSRQFGGLGLGLSISKKLVDLHHGHLTATSPGAGQGATFAVYLPTIPTPAHNGKSRQPPVHPEPLHRLHILLVEDHDDTRRNMSRLLSALKHDVQTASNATEALELAAHTEFDLVISDVGLPDRSGFELMRELRDAYQLKGICLSGFGMDSDIAKAHNSGFATHLTKPINFRRLEQAISDVMNHGIVCEAPST